MDEENKIYGRSVRAYAGKTEDVAGQEDVS